MPNGSDVSDAPTAFLGAARSWHIAHEGLDLNMQAMFPIVK